MAGANLLLLLLPRRNYIKSWLLFFYFVELSVLGAQQQLLPVFPPAAVVNRLQRD